MLFWRENNETSDGCEKDYVGATPWAFIFYGLMKGHGNQAAIYIEKGLLGQ